MEKFGLKTCIFALVVALVYGESMEGGCRLTDWSEWGECEATHPCNYWQMTPQRPSSFQMEATTYDEGREKMAVMMELKDKMWEQREACREDGSCPELNVRASSGVAKCVDGMAGSFPCRNIDQMSFINFDDLGYYNILPSDKKRQGNDIWGWTDPETGDEYVIMGLSGGSSFIRVTDPYNPEVLGFLYSRTVASTWRDMKVVNNAVYIVSEAKDHGLQVYDLTLLRGKTGFSFLEATAEYSLFGNAHNIVANEETSTLFVVGATDRNYALSCRGGLHMIDASDPLNPTYVGCFPDDGYVHDAQCLIYRGPDDRYHGREICFCYNEDTLTLVDVTDKANAKLISKRGYMGSMYTHQGWLTEDYTTVLLDDELDELYSYDSRTKTLVWDVRDLENPVLRNTYLSSQNAIDHNQYIVGDYSFQSNYGAGLRIVYIDQENYDLEEMAYFDCFPSRTRAEFTGTWSNYPYFKSGTVAVSSIDYGLFLLRPHYEKIADEVRLRVKYGEMTRERDVVGCIPGVVCPDLVQHETCPVVECPMA